jgi:hypothetical protein
VLNYLPVFGIIDSVMVDPINAALETAHQKLNQLLTDRVRIDKEIVEWKQLVDSLLAVSQSDESDPSDVELGDFIARELGTKALKFTDGVRMVLSQNASRKVPISVPEIRDQLINLGFDFAKYAQQLVPIHNTLKRLEEQGEVTPLKNEEGQTLGYKWISPIERALNEQPAQISRNIFADRFAAGRPTRETAIAALEALEKNKTEAKTARERFVDAHKAKLARERVVEEMHKAGSEVGTPLSIENEDQRNSRKKK